MEFQETIAKVVASGLCTSCGTCMAVCPEHAISMQENSTGFLFAHVESSMCTDCGFCSRICPGSHVEKAFVDGQIDQFKGTVLAAFRGYATDPTIRSAGQSGGIVTALSKYLIASGQIENALLTTMPANGSLRPQAALQSLSQNICDAQASKYCPVAVNAPLPEQLKHNIVTVGLACHVHGIRNVQTYRKDWRDHIILTIGLFCDCVMTFGAIDYLIQKGGLEKKTVVSLRYKDKRHGHFPGNVVIQTLEQKTRQVSNAQRLRCKRLFKPARCSLCFDKVNVFSDIAVGDAWGIVKSKEGISVVLARTERGLQALLDAQKAGIIHLEPVDTEAVFRGQGVESRRRAWSTYSQLWKQQKRQLPEFHIPSAYQGEPERGKKYHIMQNDFAWASYLASCTTPGNVARAVKRREWYLSARALFALPGRIFKKIFSYR